MKKIDRRFVLFSLIGVFNTFLDIAVYLAAYSALHSILWANLIATSVALVGSYILNSKLTFKAKDWTRKGFVLFVGITLFGLWVIQTSLIYFIAHILGLIPGHTWQVLGGLGSVAKTLAPKLIATCFTFVWNFVWYEKVIFRASLPPEEAVFA